MTEAEKRIREALMWVGQTDDGHIAVTEDALVWALAEIDRLTRERDEARAERDALRAEVVTLQNERAEARMLVDLLERSRVNAVELLTTALAQIEQERSEQAKEG